MATAVIDFDKTLISIDSTVLMLRDGYALSSFFILFWGAVLWAARFVLPHSRQIFIRRKLRHALFKEIYQRGAVDILTSYAEKLLPYVNEDLIRYVSGHYDKVYVSTSAWKDLVEAVLVRKNISGWTVHGTEYNPDFFKFFTCWHGAKTERLKACGVEHFDLFTDSEEDRPLMNAADHIFLVKGDNFASDV